METIQDIRGNPKPNADLTLKPNKKFRWIKIVPYIFVAPAVIYLTIVTLIPAILALPISFTDWTALSPKMNFIGIENYKALLQDEDYFKSLIIMVQYFFSVPLIMAVGLVLALLLNNKLKGMTIFRVIYYSPFITSTVAAAVLFEWLYQPTFGLFNSVLEAIGLPGLGWVMDPDTAVLSVIIFRVWKNSGEAMLIYLAGLQGVPDAYLEAASIDGANWWQRFRYVTLPLLKPAHVYLSVVGIIKVFMIFQETYMLQAPGHSNRSIVNYIYEKGFMSSEMGYACAMSFVLFVVILIMTFIQNKALNADKE